MLVKSTKAPVSSRRHHTARVHWYSRMTRGLRTSSCPESPTLQTGGVWPSRRHSERTMSWADTLPGCDSQGQGRRCVDEGGVSEQNACWFVLLGTLRWALCTFYVQVPWLMVPVGSHDIVGFTNQAVASAHSSCIRGAHFVLCSVFAGRRRSSSSSTRQRALSNMQTAQK